jgi:hypothetical protein
MSKIVDNFLQIETLLSFDNDDVFYFGQIIQRRKDLVRLGINEVGPDNRIVKDIYIKSLKEYKEKQNLIKDICHATNSRFYMHLNKRSKKDVAFELLKIVADALQRGDDYSSLRSSYATACGQKVSDKDKKWIIDIDCDVSQIDWKAIEGLKNCRPEGEKILAILPTLNGVHIITKPFDSSFVKGWKVDIHKNNPTVVYCRI